MYMHLSHCSVTNAGLDNLPCKAADFTFPLQPVNNHDKPLAHGEHHCQMVADKLKNIPEVLAILETVLPVWCPILSLGCWVLMIVATVIVIALYGFYPFFGYAPEVARPPPSPVTVVLISVLVLLCVILSLWDCGGTRFKTGLAGDVVRAGRPPAGPPALGAAD